MATQPQHHRDKRFEQEQQELELIERRWAITKQRWELFARMILLCLVVAVVIVCLIRGEVAVPSIAGLGTVPALVRAGSTEAEPTSESQRSSRLSAT